MTEPHKKEIEFAIRIRDSIKKDLVDILEDNPGLHLDTEFRGDAILWSIGSFYGKINIIHTDEVKGTALLELPLDIDYRSNASIYPSSLRTVLKIYDKLEEYLKKNGGEPISEHLGRRCFSMKKIP